jgi:hypothetical protein
MCCRCPLLLPPTAAATRCRHPPRSAHRCPPRSAHCCPLRSAHHCPPRSAHRCQTRHFILAAPPHCCAQLSSSSSGSRASSLLLSESGFLRGRGCRRRRRRVRPDKRDGPGMSSRGCHPRLSSSSSRHRRRLGGLGDVFTLSARW